MEKEIGIMKQQEVLNFLLCLHTEEVITKTTYDYMSEQLLYVLRDILYQMPEEEPE